MYTLLGRVNHITPNQYDHIITQISILSLVGFWTLSHSIQMAS